MKRLLLAITAAVLAASSDSAVAGAGNFTVVNATGADITALSIRRFGSRGDWQPLSTAPRAGAKGAVTFTDNDCAFDLQGKLAGGVTAVWSGVNLCEANAITLNRNDSGAVWVDYD
jgi:hypothetical protein